MNRSQINLGICTLDSAIGNLESEGIYTKQYQDMSLRTSMLGTSRIKSMTTSNSNHYVASKILLQNIGKT